MKEQSNLICGKFAVGRNYNLTRDMNVTRLPLRNQKSEYITQEEF